MKVKSCEQRYADAYTSHDISSQVGAAKSAVRQMFLRDGTAGTLDSNAYKVALQFAAKQDPGCPDIQHASFVVGIAIGQLYDADVFVEEKGRAR